MRILVTGAAGYIGSHTARMLMDRGHDVFVFDSLTRGHGEAIMRLGLSDRFFPGDLNEPARLDHAFTVARPDAVLHFAAYALVGESVIRPDIYWKNNLVGSLGLLEAMRLGGVKKLVFSSTCATYGIPDQVPMNESLPQSPINPYGQTKLAMEKAIIDYAHAFGTKAISLRYFNAAGASEKGDIGEDHEPESHLIPLAIRAAQGTSKPLTIFGTDYPTPDGTCIRDYIHVNDLAEAHIAALLHLDRQSTGTHDAFNLGTGRGYSVKEIITCCEEITGLKVPHTFGPRRDGDPPVLVADPSKAAKILGWKAKEGIVSIVRSAWNWHKNYPQGYKTPKA
jgi:nucleoside-diphosphate-sugar epimerase